MESDRRENIYFFHNDSPDYPHGLQLLDSKGKLLPQFRGRIENGLSLLYGILVNDTKRDKLKYKSVYIGKAGYSLVFFRMQTFNHKKNLNLAIDHMFESIKDKDKNNTISFLEGKPGILAVGAAILYQGGNATNAYRLVDDIMAMLPSVLGFNTKYYDEVLYGRAGYLYSLLFVRYHLNGNAPGCGKEEVQAVINAIIQSGQNGHDALVNQGYSSSQIPALFYNWHDTAYVGAAHGFAGIIHTILLACKQENLPVDLRVKKTLDYILYSCRWESGNYKSSFENNSDRLVQWCHGAPAVIHAFIKGYQIFDDEMYLRAALDCGEVIWKRGLLRKGYSLCHGVAGNGYAFLALYHATKDQKHLFRAIKFGEFCCEYGRHGCRQPDRPLSLFEGLSGVVHFLADILDFERSAFPGYEIPRL